MRKKKEPVLPKIPDKKYFKIQEVAKLTQVPEYTLRYWETEFKELAPQKSRGGHRLYQKQDLELIFKIKHLLYDQKFTIQGARKELSAQLNKPVEKPEQRQLELGFEQNLLKDMLKKTLQELKEIEKQLRS